MRVGSDADGSFPFGRHDQRLDLARRVKMITKKRIGTKG